jgi:hypothetical protein
MDMVANGIKIRSNHAILARENKIILENVISITMSNKMI